MRRASRPSASIRSIEVVSSGPSRPSGLRPNPPEPWEALANVVRGGVGDDDFGATPGRVDDAVLPKDPAERDRLFTIHRVDEPRRLAPDPLGLRLGADARLDPVTAEDQEVPEHEMPPLV